MAKWHWQLGGLLLLGGGGYVAYEFLFKQQIDGIIAELRAKLDELFSGIKTPVPTETETETDPQITDEEKQERIQKAIEEIKKTLKKLGMKAEGNPVKYYDIKTNKQLTDAEVQKRINEYNKKISKSNFTDVNFAIKGYSGKKLNNLP